MNNENMIDLINYRQQQLTPTHSSISHELADAIDNLIHRLRELGPLQAAKGS